MSKLVITNSQEQQKILTYVNQINGDHYSVLGYQPWDFIRDTNLDFFFGNAVKYVARWRSKNGIGDLEKAISYVEKAEKFKITPPFLSVKNIYVTHFVAQLHEDDQEIIKTLVYDRYTSINQCLANAVANYKSDNIPWVPSDKSNEVMAMEYANFMITLGDDLKEAYDYKLNELNENDKKRILDNVIIT